MNEQVLIKQDPFGYWTAHTRTAIVARHLELDRVLWDVHVYLSGIDTDHIGAHHG